jgi:transposase
MVLWPLAKELIPRTLPRPQGGGTRRTREEAIFAAVMFVLVSGIPWRDLPKTFDVSWQNAHRRFCQWSDAGLWEDLLLTARHPQVPSFTSEWALIIRAAAERRIHRPTHKAEEHDATEPMPAPTALAPRPANAAMRKPLIRVHRRGSIMKTIFSQHHRDLPD